MLAQLQSPDIPRDGPTVARRHLLLIRRHRPIAVRNDVEKMADGDLAKALDMVGRRLRVAALDDFAVAGAKRIMADDTKDHVAIAAMFEHLARHWERKRVVVTCSIRPIILQSDDGECAQRIDARPNQHWRIGTSEFLGTAFAEKQMLVGL